MKGWGPKSSVCPSKPRESNFFGGISQDFAGISPKRPKSLRKKCLGSIFGPYSGFGEVSSSEDAMRGWGTRGGRNTSRRTALPKQVLEPPLSGTFSTPMQCHRSVFHVQRPTTEQARSSFFLEGPRNFWEGAFSGTFSSPHTFCTPHIMAQQVKVSASKHESQGERTSPQIFTVLGPNLDVIRLGSRRWSRTAQRGQSID